MQPVWLCLFLGRQFEDTFENTQWRKAKQMQPMRLCLFWGRRFEDTFENTQWRKVTKNPMKLHKFLSNTLNIHIQIAKAFAMKIYFKIIELIALRTFKHKVWAFFVVISMSASDICSWIHFERKYKWHNSMNYWLCTLMCCYQVVPQTLIYVYGGNLTVSYSHPSSWCQIPTWWESDWWEYAG